MNIKFIVLLDIFKLLFEYNVSYKVKVNDINYNKFELSDECLYLKFINFMSFPIKKIPYKSVRKFIYEKIYDDIDDIDHDIYNQEINI